jgi:hypothetical protein
MSITPGTKHNPRASTAAAPGKRNPPEPAQRAQAPQPLFFPAGKTRRDENRKISHINVRFPAVLVRRYADNTQK